MTDQARSMVELYAILEGEAVMRLDARTIRRGVEPDGGYQPMSWA